jgi:hypothetical protein
MRICIRRDKLIIQHDVDCFDRVELTLVQDVYPHTLIYYLLINNLFLNILIRLISLAPIKQQFVAPCVSSDSTRKVD